MLLKITNDLWIASDKETTSIVLLLDLSAAFDTVDLPKLINILSDVIGLPPNHLRKLLRKKGKKTVCGKLQRKRRKNRLNCVRKGDAVM